MQLPARFGKYELQQFLGGGMSHVYRALDTVIGRQVAVKILTDTAAADPESKERFLLEARMSGTFQHDHVITIHDYGETEGRPYIVMEFLTGRDLRELMRSGQAGDLTNRLRIAWELASALEYVHSRNVIHRDIKPENVFIEQSGRSKLMDFGISKAAGFHLTKAGNTMGTPYYMSPEQVTGSNITPLVDIYSFGVLLYELLSGVRLVNGDSMERLFYQVLHENPDSAVLRAASIPQSAIDLVTRCASKKPEDRIQSFGAVKSMLGAILAEVRDGGPPAMVSSGSQSAGVPVKTIRMGPIIGIAVFTLVLAGLGIWALLRQRATVEAPIADALKPEGPAIRIDHKGGEMLLVPEGEFLFGSARSSIRLPAFYVDRTEVSNRSYKEFATASGHELPDGFAADLPDLPVTNVEFGDAKDFCAWALKRLPSEREWEKAARGSDGRNYPWGDEADPKRAVVSSNKDLSGKAPNVVESLVASASPHGALHMAGNVWEWVEHPHTPSPQAIESFRTFLKPPPTASEPWHYIKGGAYDKDLNMALTFEWSSVPARLANPTIGFRCVMDPPVSPTP